MKPVKPEPASTVILVREVEDNIHVFMTRRRDELMFLGGFHVFPGGKVDPDDCCEAVAQRCMGLAPDQARASLDVDISPEQGLGFFIAGIRELFEEAGILLAYDASGNEFTWSDETERGRFMEYRKLIQQDKLKMTSMIEQENLYYAADRLLWFAHWVTPATSPRRFDTQFFIARIPQGQKTKAFAGEIADSDWVTPARAIEQWRSRKIRIIPPTLASLDRLSRYSNWGQIKQDCCVNK